MKNLSETLIQMMLKVGPYKDFDLESYTSNISDVSDVSDIFDVDKFERELEPKIKDRFSLTKETTCQGGTCVSRAISSAQTKLPFGVLKVVDPTKKGIYDNLLFLQRLGGIYKSTYVVIETGRPKKGKANFIQVFIYVPMDWKHYYDDVETYLSRNYRDDTLKMMCICICHECQINKKFDERIFVEIKKDLNKVLFPNKFPCNYDDALEREINLSIERKEENDPTIRLCWGLLRIKIVSLKIGGSPTMPGAKNCGFKVRTIDGDEEYSVRTKKEIDLPMKKDDKYNESEVVYTLKREYPLQYIFLHNT